MTVAAPTLAVKTPADPRVFDDVRDPDASAASRTVDTDADLMQRIASGDRLAYARLVDRHLDRTVAIAQRILGRRADAEDVAQETFLRVWTQAQRWEPGHGRVATWLYRITFNLCIDQKRRPSAAPLDDAIDPPDPAEPADERIARVQTEVAVARAVADLPDRQRDAVALTYQGGLSNQDAAAAMGVSVGSLESLLVRARRALRTALGGHDSARRGA
jgi:RNA polymerase sigma-70 factor, ECF subfamily